MALKINSKLQDAILTSGFTSIGTGTMIIYAGSRPENTDSPPTGTALVSISLGGFEGEASDGFLSLSSKPKGVATANGTASWFRITAGDKVMDGDIGEDLSLNSTAIVAQKAVKILFFGIYQPSGQ